MRAAMPDFSSAQVHPEWVTRRRRAIHWTWNKDRSGAIASQQIGWKGVGKLLAESNYFLGNAPRKWRTHVPRFARVETIFDGIAATGTSEASNTICGFRLRWATRNRDLRFVAQ
jgi:hypothetical protein